MDNSYYMIKHLFQKPTIIVVISILVSSMAYTQPKSFRGVVETKEFFIEKAEEVPFIIAAQARLHKLPVSEFDTIYNKYTICDDTIVRQIYSLNHLMQLKGIQFDGTYFFKDFINGNYINFGRNGGGSEMKEERKDWKKVRQKKYKSSYDYHTVSKINGTFEYFIEVDTAYLYDQQMNRQGQFANVFNPFGAYKKKLTVNGDGEQLTLFSYFPDENCTCRDLMQDFIIEDTSEVDPNLLPPITYKYELTPAGERPELPFFKVDDDTGQAFYPSDLHGKITYIDLWASWCMPCRAEMPYLQVIVEEYAAKGLQVISLSLDKAEDWNKWISTMEKYEMSWTNWILPDGFDSDFARELTIHGIPRYLLIDAESRIANDNAPRPSDKEAIGKLIEQLLDGK